MHFLVYVYGFYGSDRNVTIDNWFSWILLSKDKFNNQMINGISNSKGRHKRDSLTNKNLNPDIFCFIF